MTDLANRAWELTPGSMRLLNKLLKDGAGNGFYEESNSTFMLNGELSQSEKGNLLDLKVKGYVSTQDDDRGYWVIFTDKALMLSHEGRLHLDHLKAISQEGA